MNVVSAALIRYFTHFEMLKEGKRPYFLDNIPFINELIGRCSEKY